MGVKKVSGHATSSRLPPRCLRKVWCQQALAKLKAVNSHQRHGGRHQLCRDSRTLVCIRVCAEIHFLPMTVFYLCDLDGKRHASSLLPAWFHFNTWLCSLMLSSAAQTGQRFRAPPAFSIINPCRTPVLAYGTKRMQHPGRNVKIIQVTWAGVKDSGMDLLPHNNLTNERPYLQSISEVDRPIKYSYLRFYFYLWGG